MPKRRLGRYRFMVRKTERTLPSEKRVLTAMANPDVVGYDASRRDNDARSISAGVANSKNAHSHDPTTRWG